MSDTLVETEEFTPLPLEEHTYFELGNTLCFIANTPDVKKNIDALWPTLNRGPVYYMLSCISETIEDPKTKKKSVLTMPRLMRVTLTPIGSTVQVVDWNPGLESYTPQAIFNLPKIPYQMINDMDAFFRAVEEKYDTEAIVILTYNPKIGGSKGWGLLVPKQENTSAHCDYNPQSIVADKDPDCFIVGTAHSHPGMSAFASTTDHADQANMDGLHITFGWQSSVNNGATQYWIEFQLMGQIYQYRPEQIFEMLPPPETSDEVESWMENVSKKVHSPVQTQYKPGYTTHTPVSGGYNSGSRSFPHTQDKRAKAVIPQSAPSNCILIGELPGSNVPVKCPFCKSALMNRDLDRRRCMSCHMHICLVAEELDEFVEARRKAGGFVRHLDPKQGEVTQDIYIWRPNVGTLLSHLDDDELKEYEFDLVYEVPEEDSKKARGGADFSDSSYSGVLVAQIWCPTCQDFKLLSQIDKDLGICTFCEESVYDSEDTQNVTVMCDECQSEMPFEVANCPQCNEPYPVKYWVTAALDLVTEWLPTGSKVSYSGFTEDTNLCCDQDNTICDCEHPLHWDSMWDIPNGDYVKIYDYSSDCNSCIHFSDPDCLPLRNWIRGYLHEGITADELGTIDSCENYSAQF